MNEQETKRMTDAELKAFFERLFPSGFSGTDVLAEIAPEGWEKSPLLACFHPSAEQVFKERVRMHRNMEKLVAIRREREPDNPKLAARTEPTLEEVRSDWKEMPVNMAEEVTDLVGLCLWDVFSDNHEVIAADGRIVDIGSFRGAAAFLDEYLAGAKEGLWSFDYVRFYMGTIWISDRADLGPVYRMIYRRLKEMGADWQYHFPELGIVDLSSSKKAQDKPEDYSPSEAFAREQDEAQGSAELEQFRAELAQGNEQARREALDRPSPATVRAYQIIYGRDPKGWPPA